MFKIYIPCCYRCRYGCVAIGVGNLDGRRYVKAMYRAAGGVSALVWAGLISGLFGSSGAHAFLTKDSYLGG